MSKDNCKACGEPLHPTLPGIAVTEDRWGFWNTELKAAFVPLEIRDEAEARELADSNEIPIRVTMTYNVPEGM